MHREDAMINLTRNLMVRIAALLTAIIALIAIPPAASRVVRADPGVLYAAPEARGSGNCSSWANACTLQTALTQAQSGDEIWVMSGVHYPGAAGDRTATFALKNGVAVYGGFAGAESSRIERDWQINRTILSGDIDRNDVNDDGNFIAETFQDQRGENAYNVVTGNGTDRTAVLDGFVITAGDHDINAGGGGGGMRIRNGAPTLANVVFSGNKGDYGGGMYVQESAPTLTNIVFSGNFADMGGGMFNLSGAPELIRVTFSENRAGWGGGMYNRGEDRESVPILTDVTFRNNSAGRGGGIANEDKSKPILTNVTFFGNYAYSGGGGIYNGGSSPVLKNVTFLDNSTEYGGGGMYNTVGRYNGDFSEPSLFNVALIKNRARKGGGLYNSINSSSKIVNVTFSENSAQEGGGIYIYDSPSINLMLVNVIMWGDNAATGAEIYKGDSGRAVIRRSNIQGCGGSGSGWNAACGTDGGGNIDADPRFVDRARNDLRLSSGSPCIDAGDNSAVPADITTDRDGKPRFVDIRDIVDTGNGAPPIIDMGAYEAHFDITLGKTVAASTVAPGQSITFTLALSNTGSLPATGLVVTDTVQFLRNTAFASSLIITDTGSIPPYVWRVQDLALGQGGVITVSGVVPVPQSAGVYTNTAIIAAPGDPLPENNTAVVTFTVLNVAPMFTSIPVVTSTQHTPYAYTVTARDDNGDALTITAPTLPGWLTLTDHGNGAATLTGTPPIAGTYAVVLRVADQAGLTAEQSFTITVAEKPLLRLFLPLIARNAP